MADLNTLPLEDGFETTLSQEWTGGVGTVNVNATPNFTFPAGVKTYIVVNPTKSNIQIAEINAYNAGLKTLTVSNITLEKGASVNSTAQTHAVNSKVIISDNYQFWADIRTAINSKIDKSGGTFTGEVSFSGTTIGGIRVNNLTTAQRDAIASPQNGMIIYNTTTSVHNQYIGGAWTTFATGAVVNATETVSGKVELPTDAEVTAKTATGGTGATLTPTNAQIGKSVSLKAVDATMAETDHIVFDKAGTDNKMLKSVLRDQLAGDKTKKGTFEMLTDAEAVTGTDETRVPNIKQVDDNYLGKGETQFATASNTLKYSADTVQSIGESINYIEKKAITQNVKGTIRVEFDMEKADTGGGTSYGRIYINAVPAGTERSDSIQNGYTTYGENFSVNIGDRISLYLKGLGTGVVTNCKNFRLYYDKTYIADGIVVLN